MTFNDMLLSWLALDVIGDKNDDDQGEKKESLFFTGLCLLVIGILVVFTVLSKLGVSSEQLQMALVVMLAPFLWDYFINFTVMDMTNTQHILAAGGTILVAVIILIILEVAARVSDSCAKSTVASIQSFGFVVHMVAGALKWFTQAVLIFAVFKVILHIVLAFLFWLF